MVSGILEAEKPRRNKKEKWRKEKGMWWKKSPIKERDERIRIRIRK